MAIITISNTLAENEEVMNLIKSEFTTFQELMPQYPKTQRFYVEGEIIPKGTHINQDVTLEIQSSESGKLSVTGISL